jgi:large subunit ribosomal protein L34
MITFFGTKRKAIRVSGFRARLKTQSGRKILKNRRKKGRKVLALK